MMVTLYLHTLNNDGHPNSPTLHHNGYSLTTWLKEPRQDSGQLRQNHASLERASNMEGNHWVCLTQGPKEQP